LFYQNTLVSSTNKSDCHNRTEILFKEALNTITLTLFRFWFKGFGEFCTGSTVVISRLNSAAYLDDTEGLFIIGGSDTRAGFNGYIGKLTYYRYMAVEPSQVGIIKLTYYRHMAVEPSQVGIISI